MQSDKHLNNMQELNSTQNINNSSGTTDIRESPKIILPNMQQQSTKPKPSFRCDVCSYETSVARNLRIHMTSEKHTHNMAVLQNNIKHLQALSFLQSQNIGQLPNISNLPNLTSLGQTIPSLAAAQQQLPNLGPNLPNIQNFLPEAALADLAYNQALMIQLLHQNSSGTSLSNSNGITGANNGSGVGGGGISGCGSGSSVAGGGVSPMPATAVNATSIGCSGGGSLESDHGLNPDSFEPPIEPDHRPTFIFSCLVCACFNTSNIEELNQHLLIDRSRTCNSDIMLIINSNYICRLCNYKTNLKANYQLHSKTDKHIQKLNYINHIKEGGIKNQYKLKYNSNNSVQLKCNCCDYYTNSIQKLNLHSQNMRHENAKIIFNHLIHVLKTAEFINISNDSTKETVSSPETLLPVNLECNDDTVNASGGSLSATSAIKKASSPVLPTIVAGSGNSNSTSITIAKPNSNLNKFLLCQLCNHRAPHTLDMIQHVKSLRHVQIEQIICLQRRSENLDAIELNDVFKVITDSSGKLSFLLKIFF